MTAAITLHVLAAVVWVGGMFFAYVALRPVAGAVLEPPERLALWAGALGIFFRWVWAAVAALLASGYWMVFAVFGGFGSAGMHIQVMHAAGLLMTLLFAHVFFAPYRRLRRAVEAGDWPGGARHLAAIRRVVAVNLTLGILVVAAASGGRYAA